MGSARPESRTAAGEAEKAGKRPHAGSPGSSCRGCRAARRAAPFLLLLLSFFFLLLPLTLLLPLQPSSPPRPSPREFSRERRAPTRVLPGLRVRRVLEVLEARDRAQAGRWGHQAREGRSAPLGVVAERSEPVGWVSAVGKGMGSTPGCLGLRRGLASARGLLPVPSVQQGAMKGYGVPLLVHKSRRRFNVFGVCGWCSARIEKGVKLPVVLWFCLKTLN